MEADVSRSARGRSGAPCEQCVLAAACPIATHASAPALRRELDVLPRSVKRGVRLQREGERLQQMRFIKSGLLGVRQTGIDGVERAIAVIGPGFLIGQPSTHGLPAVMTVQTLTQVSVCEFPFSTLQRLLALGFAEAPSAGHFVRQSMMSLTAWSHLTRMPSLVKRMATALRLLAGMQPHLTVLLPSQAVLAELLCVTRESVNRLWKDFEARGIVRRRQGYAVELDLRALEELSSAND